MNTTKPNISPNDLKPMICTECGGMYFKQVMCINKVSRFLTGQNKDTVYPVPVFRFPTDSGLCDILIYSGKNLSTNNLSDVNISMYPNPASHKVKIDLSELKS